MNDQFKRMQKLDGIITEGMSAYEYEKGKEAGEKIEKKKMKKSELKKQIKEMILAEMTEGKEINEGLSPEIMGALTDLAKSMNISVGELIGQIAATVGTIGGVGGAMKYAHDSFKAGLPKDIVVRSNKDDKNLDEARVSPDNRVEFLTQALQHVWNMGKGNNSIDFKDMAKSTISDMFDNMNEAKKKKDEEEVEDITVDDTEMTAEPSSISPSYDAQKELMDVLEAAKSIGDEKLVRQIGNALTYFTRTQVADKEAPTMSEGIEDTDVSEEAYDRMNSLVNQNDLKNFIDSASNMMRDLTDEGFEPVEVFYYLYTRLTANV